MSYFKFITEVEFREIDGFPGYQCGDDGSVWSLWRNAGPKPAQLTATRQTLLKPGSGTKGHRYVNLHRDGKQNSIYVHRIILEAFRGPCPEGMEGCHNDGNPSNNALRNLRWDTPVANNQDKVRHGTVLRGEKVHCAKLRAGDVLAIRSFAGTGESASEIARKFQVSTTTVQRVLKRKIWAHVP